MSQPNTAIRHLMVKLFKTEIARQTMLPPDFFITYSKDIATHDIVTSENNVQIHNRNASPNDVTTEESSTLSKMSQLKIACLQMVSQPKLAIRYQRM